MSYQKWAAWGGYLQAADFADDVLIDDDFMKHAAQVVEKFAEAFKGSGPLTEQHGHDLWLTRQGHGAGFWDRPTFYGAALSERLTAYAESLGPFEDYLTSDDDRCLSDYVDA